MVLEGAKQLSRGQKPQTADLLLTVKNVEQITNKLSHLRGAAMKLGQIVSMDAGELISPEFSAVLAKLRKEASPMPHKQLVMVLKNNWGENWLDEFSQFELRPFAAASIGQVHLAYLATGEKLAVKIQYPGVADSIESDVDNVATLLRVSGLLPSHLEITPLLEQAKKQLQYEANYQLESSYIEQYQAHLDADEFSLPQVYPNLSTPAILVMGYVDGRPIEDAVNQPQEVRNRIVEQLICLFLQELFDFRLMQTDPNFANFLFDQETGKIGLLDFGATRAIPEHVSEGYLVLIKAGLKGNSDSVESAARQIGFFKGELDQDYLVNILKIFELACEPVQFDGAYDFAKSQLATRIKTLGLQIGKQTSQWHTPPVDALFIHRKVAGLYLLACKLEAKVNVNKLLSEPTFGNESPQ